MRFSIYFITPMLASIVILNSKNRCQSLDITMKSTTMDYSVDKFSQAETISPTEPSSSVVTLKNKSPKYIAQEILRMNSKKVEEIHLDSNGLTSLPASILTLSKIESMSLVDNGISSISSIEVINLLPRLRNLALSQNPLKTLKGLAIHSLETLEADYCEIEEIDGILPDALPVLKKLNLTGNFLGTVRELISESLTNLVLKNCRLSYLNSKSFLGLTNLTYLDLEENGLTTMPDTIFSRKNNLRYLNVGKNHLTSLRNAWFNDMPNLETLYLFKNEITSIDEIDFTALSSLSKLNLADNKLTTFPNLDTAVIDVNLSRNFIRNKSVWDLSKMAKIRRLDLSHNRLEGNCDTFKSTSLGILILGYNKLTIIKEESISDLPNLSDINLKGNRIAKGVSPKIFQHNPNLINMELDDNPWSCNCTELFPLYFYIANGQKTQTTHLICHSPKNASGHTWWEFCNQVWRELMIAEDYIERGTMWIIVISAGFGSCVIFGTMLYITYTFKKNRPAQSRDNTI